MANSIRINFLRPDHFKLFPAVGVWGGVSPQGEIVAKFFLDDRRDPDHMMVDIQNNVPSERERIGENDPEGNAIIQREFQTGVVLRADIARSIGEWLISKADEAIAQSRSMGSERSN